MQEGVLFATIEREKLRNEREQRATDSIAQQGIEIGSRVAIVYKNSRPEVSGVVRDIHWADGLVIKVRLHGILEPIKTRGVLAIRKLG